MYTKATEFGCPACGTKLKQDENVSTEVESVNDENVLYDGVSLKCPFCSTDVSMPIDEFDTR